MNGILPKLNSYINDALGLSPKLNPVEDKARQKLPLILRNKYDLHETSLEGQQMILAIDSGAEPVSAEKLRKQMEILTKILDKRVVYVTDKMKSYNRKRLINKKISFMVPGKQLYIPGMLIDLQDFGLTPGKRTKAMTPAIQFLLLYHLQVETLEGLPLNVIAKKLNFGPMTISRAAAYFSDEIDICSIDGKREKKLEFHKSGSELWRLVEPLMSDPVVKAIYTADFPANTECRVSGINALAHFTNISGDDQQCIALEKQHFKELMKGKKVMDLGINDGEFAVESWKYDPAALSVNEFIDPLSLFLIFRNNPDERIQIALTQMMENIKW